MVKTPSNMMELGTKAPSFKLSDGVGGPEMSLEELKGAKGTVVLFICNHCPFVVHIQDGLGKLGRDYADSPVNIVAINSNDVAEYPADSPENMKKFAKSVGITYPYLFDETQEIARAYGAACTPDIFVFDGDLKCVYRGQFDGSRPGNDVAVTGESLRKAMDQLSAGEPVPAEGQLPSVGCNIKYRS